MDLRAQADVAKLVDARDLKSLGLGCTGSTPVVRTMHQASLPSNVLFKKTKPASPVTLAPSGPLTIVMMAGGIGRSSPGPVNPEEMRGVR